MLLMLLNTVSQLWLSSRSSPVVLLRYQAGMTLLERHCLQPSGRLRLMSTGPPTNSSAPPEKSCTLTAAAGVRATLRYPSQSQRVSHSFIYFTVLQ